MCVVAHAPGLAWGRCPFSRQNCFKVAIIIYMAHYLSKHYTATRKLKTMLLPLLLMMGGFLLIMCQPDFGTGCVMALSVIVMIMVTAFPFKYFLWLAGIGVLGGGDPDSFSALSSGTHHGVS